MKKTIQISESILADDQKRRHERLIQDEIANQIDQKMFLLLMKKRGITKDKKIEKLFEAVAPYLPCDEIIEMYTD